MLAAILDTEMPDQFIRKQYLEDLGFNYKPYSTVSTVSEELEATRTKKHPLNTINLTRCADDGRIGELSNSFVFPRNIFSSNGYRLKSHRFLDIRVQKGEELWFAQNQRYDVFATGVSIKEAVHEFNIMIVDFYQHYKELRFTKGTKAAIRLKDLYQETFTEQNR